MYAVYVIYIYFAEGHHGNRGGAHGLGESAAPSGALFLLGYAGLGLLHSRYELHKQKSHGRIHMRSCFSAIFRFLDLNVCACRFCIGVAGKSAHLWPGAEQTLPCILLLSDGKQCCQPGCVCCVPPQRAAGLARKCAGQTSHMHIQYSYLF